jgi:hypothetical protein
MCIHISFIEAIKDLPFAVISLALLILFPWRFNYLWNVIKDQHTRIPIVLRNHKINVAGKRKEILILAWNIIKTDFVCFILNIILILSISKTKKGIELAIKNVKRNLIQGFLPYDYRR